LVAEHPPQHLSRRQARDVSDHDDMTKLLVSRQRCRHELLQLVFGHEEVGIE
jgi:hypothetical protein